MMAHGLAEQQFRSYEDIEKWFDSWIASKDDDFYRNSIQALPETLFYMYMESEYITLKIVKR